MGIELTDKWANIAKKRLNLYKKSKTLEEFTSADNVKKNEKFSKNHFKVFVGDSKEILRNFDDNSIDFIVTSPPYWRILNKKLDHKSKIPTLSAFRKW